MLKYKPDTVQVVFEEIPDEVTLAIEITNCQGRCVGCHSPWLREDMGDELTPDKLFGLIENNRGITCVCFMGEGKDPEALKRLAKDIHVRYPHLKTALYSGRDEVEDGYDLYFNYLKIGAFRPEFGPLNRETTNQRLYRVEAHLDDGESKRIDITNKFWRKKV